MLPPIGRPVRWRRGQGRDPRYYQKDSRNEAGGEDERFSCCVSTTPTADADATEFAPRPLALVGEIPTANLPSHPPATLARAATFPPAAGEWFRAEGVLVGCPGCGAAVTPTERTHRVRPDGAVAPSFVRPNPGCGFHAFVRLDGYVPSGGDA